MQHGTERLYCTEKRGLRKREEPCKTPGIEEDVVKESYFFRFVLMAFESSVINTGWKIVLKK